MTKNVITFEVKKGYTISYRTRWHQTPTLVTPLEQTAPGDANLSDATGTDRTGRRQPQWRHWNRPHRATPTSVMPLEQTAPGDTNLRDATGTDRTGRHQP